MADEVTTEAAHEREEAAARRFHPSAARETAAPAAPEEEAVASIFDCRKVAVFYSEKRAIRAVPPSIREGSLALGATQWQTIRRQVLPAAIPGIATGVILALSRAIGETAPLIVIGVATFVAFDPTGPMSFFTALPIQIFDWISRASNDVNNYKPLAAAAILLLMILLLLMNSVAIWLRNRYEQKW